MKEAGQLSGGAKNQFYSEKEDWVGNFSPLFTCEFRLNTIPGLKSTFSFFLPVVGVRLC